MYKNINISMILIVILVILQFIIIFRKLYINRLEKLEHFQNEDTIYNKNVYDNFYSKLYDQLFYSKSKVEYECSLINKYIKLSNKKTLDVGCGTGQHLVYFKKYDITGLDNSDAMLKIAKKKVPNVRLIKGNFGHADIFEHQQFDNIYALYFVIYYQKSISLLLNNCYKWLKPGGNLVIHLVNPAKFDPILDPSSPFPAFSLQKYSKNRITQSSVVFNNFEYEGNFNIDLDSDAAEFTETFKFKDKSKPTRKQIHHLTIPPIKDMLSLIKNAGFVYKRKEDLVICGYEYQYLYFFTKK